MARSVDKKANVVKFWLKCSEFEPIGKKCDFPVSDGLMVNLETLFL